MQAEILGRPTTLINKQLKYAHILFQLYLKLISMSTFQAELTIYGINKKQGYCPITNVAYKKDAYSSISWYVPKPISLGRIHLQLLTVKGSTQKWLRTVVPQRKDNEKASQYALAPQCFSPHKM